MINAKRGALAMLVLAAILVVSFAVIGGCASDQVAAPGAQIIQDVSTVEANSMIRDHQGDADFVLLDVRTSEEYADGHLEGSVLIDYYSETFSDQLDELDKTKSYVIYCRSGGRSGRAHDIMRNLGFEEVYNVLGGILQWEADGLPIVE
ncbi:MAG: rhodanese-like domain-containing protein [Dehalococcoidia bacterium]